MCGGRAKTGVRRGGGEVRVKKAAKNAAAKPKAGRPAGRPAGLAAARRVAAWNRFREQYNPLVGLTMARARALVESYPRGEFADLMWLYGAPMMGIEASDADLAALIERRASALLEMDWEIRVCAPEKPGFDGKLAEEQAAALREAYDQVDNLYAAIEHLALATFRGFAHAEMWRRPDGEVHHLEPVDQWNVVRDGLRGGWRYNPEARQCGYANLPAEMEMDPAAYLYREVARPVNRIALTKVIRASMGQRDWDAFIDIYGLPGGVVIGPPGVPEEKEEVYEANALKIAEGGSGYVPHGGDYKANDGPRGVNPFRDYLDYLTEKLILAGTGGLLTMLAESGTGTLAGGAHQETFKAIARGEARRVSEVFQRGFDLPLLEGKWPTKPVLAYFAISANEETDTGDVVEQVAKLAVAGYRVTPEQVAEKTGYDLAKAEPNDPADPADPTDPTDREDRPTPANRAAANAAPDGLLAGVLGVAPRWLAPVAREVAEIERRLLEGGAGRAEAVAALEELQMRLPELLGDMDVADLATEMEAAAGTATLRGVTRELSNGNPHHDKTGRFAEGPGGSGGREFRVQTPPAVMQALGLESGHVYADAAALAAKHPEYFRDAAEAREYVEYVFARPTLVMPGNVPTHRLVVRKGEADEHKAAAIEVVKRGGKYRVKSAHTLTDKQLAAKEGAFAGQVVRLGVSRVDPENRETPSRRLGASRGALPANVAKVLAGGLEVNR
jgi:phage gp29-like protein